MGRKVQLNYDELRTFVKRFRDEGEDIVQLHSAMRDRVRNLHKDWSGEAADKFFAEMENELLPGLSRLAHALFYAQDVLHKIIKIIHDFDEDTAGYFKIDFTQVSPINLGAFAAAVGVGAALGGGLGGANAGPSDDFGASSFDQALPQGGGESAGAGQAGGGDQSQGAGAAKTPETQAAGASVGAGGGGGGGGGGSSQGLQGSLQGMGGGVGAQTGGAGGGSAGGGAQAADHIHEGTSGAGGAGGETPAPAGGAGGAAQGSAGGEGAAAAGAAGVAGSAAAGGAGKAIRGRARKKK
jgi:WXG100 family type VII secretion target